MGINLSCMSIIRSNLQANIQICGAEEKIRWIEVLPPLLQLESAGCADEEVIAANTTAIARLPLLSLHAASRLRRACPRKNVRSWHYSGLSFRMF